MRLDAGQSLIDHLSVGAVAANQPMLAKQPSVSRRAHRDRWRIGRFVRIGQAAPIERQSSYLIGAKADQAKVKVERLEVAKLDLEKIIVPAGVHRQLVVGQHIGALLGL
jgi:hypothetical protein